MAGRPPGSQNKDKPFRDALRMQIAEAGEDAKTLRKIATALLDKAATGDVQAIKEVADRLDGKVPQGVIGGDEDDPPLKIETETDVARAIAFALTKGTQDESTKH